MDKFCEDCVHKEVCQYGAYCPSGHCNDKDTLDDIFPMEIVTSKCPIEIDGNCPLKPQGEWIECTKSGMPLTEYGRMTGEKWYGFKCSQCNFIYKGNALIESPFCQKCGAKMKEGVK